MNNENATSGSEPEKLDGATYRAVRRLSTPDDETLADVGETCERVPMASLRALRDAGHIVPKGSDLMLEPQPGAV